MIFITTSFVALIGLMFIGTAISAFSALGKEKAESITAFRR
jgi:cbb3-type cytochrome oxidase subunit 3